MAEFYLSNTQGGRFQGAIDDPVESFFAVTHDCPLCGKRASTGRSLVWIASECIAKGEAVFPCASCNEYVTIPSEIFAEGCLEKLKQYFNLFQVIRQMTQSELLAPNWGEVILAANKGGPIELESLEWDGKGTCPGCGKLQALEVSQRLTCVWCQAEFWVNQNNISRTGNTNVLCSRCKRSMVIPPTVWCPVCGRNIRSEAMFLKLFREANRA